MKTILSFGKYKGIQIDQLYSIDKQYLIWLSCNSSAVRKEAQDAFLNGYKNEFCGKLNATFVKGSFDADLRYDVCFDVNGKKIYIKLNSKHDFSENFILEAEMPLQMMFTNKYSKSGKWEKAIFNDIKPLIIYKSIS